MITNDLLNRQPSTAQSVTFDANFCPNKLPCGYCLKLEKQCPMIFNTVTPSWITTATNKTGEE